MTRIYALPFLSALLLFTGCEAQQADVPPVNALAEIEGVNYSRAAPTTSRDVLHARMRASREAMDVIETALSGIPLDQPERADDAIERAVSSLNPDVQEVARQLAAVTMIDVFLDRTPNTSTTQRIAARHTQAMIDLGSPEAELIVAGFDEVGDVWDTETRRVNAQKALAPARLHLESEQARRGMSSQEKVVQENSPRLARTGTAIAALERIAQNG